MFYDKFAELCKMKGVSVTKAVEEIGFARSLASRWKKYGATPRGTTLKKIAAYFGVTESYLLEDEDSVRTVDDDLRFALFRGADVEITDEMFDEVKRFAEFVVMREKEKKKKG
ncbi:MAG: helix-turn-helix transcriptional regulator [Oscillospiraceae bacterium]|nr:helix-turn-helix transcriptional regulator [Oscillospiraceae bacterium]